MEDDCDFEHSPLSGEFTCGDITVDVEIYRTAGTRDGWRMEVVSISGGCTRWHERFDTEQDAYRAFLAMVEADGLASFGGAKPKLRH